MSDLLIRLDVRSPERRRILVSIELALASVETRQGSGAALRTAHGGPVDVEFFQPTWTPGSYLIREFSRHLGPVRASAAGTDAALPCRKSKKNRYRITVPGGVDRVRLDYWVYAHELTVRTADVTPEHAFWNHAAVLLWPVGGANLTADFEVLLPRDWDCAAGLPLQPRGDGVVTFSAPSLDAAMDAPFLAGTLRRIERQVQGVRHSVAIDGLGPATLHAQLPDHLQRIVEQAQMVFGGPLPYPHYTVLCLLADSGHGGLEHADSTVLLSPRTALTKGKSYQDFLGLLAHELFHAWNVKRMRPVEFWSYDYENENPSRLLWLAEGWTAYYDDLICRRARLLSADDYLELVAKNMAAMWTSSGRTKQSLSEASFDAWIRYYRPDENTRNSTQNYYGNGALAAMVLDLTIRRATEGANSLDQCLAALYRTTFGVGRGYTLDDVERCLSTASGGEACALLRSLVDGPLEPAFEPLLTDFGIGMEAIDRDRPYLGFALENGRTSVAHVADDSPAHASGLAPGDEVIALDGLRVASDRWADVVASVAAVGRPLRLLTATRGQIVERVLTPAAAPQSAVRLTWNANADERQARLRAGWLGSDPTSSLS